MSGNYEKSVKGGTKIKLAAPKSKYVEHILQATRSGESGVAEIFRTLCYRLRDSTWTIVFKALIIVHLMVREGENSVTLAYLASSPSKLAISNFSSVQLQGANIQHYHDYLLARAKAYRDTRVDWVREGKGRLKRQVIEKGLLRESEAVQRQIAALLKCELFSSDKENEITLTAFRLLTMDLLSLFHVMNEGTINVLEHYFEMSKIDAERALDIYKTFSRQTDQVVAYLGVARQYEHATRLEIPKLKHAPTGLTSSLEEYLNDPDFEINRRQYMAQQEAKRSGRGKATTKDPADDFKKMNLNSQSSSSTAQAKATAFPSPAQKAPSKGPAPDLMDFFESIEQNQQPMAAQPQQPVSNVPQIPQYSFQQQPQQPLFSPSSMASMTNGTAGNTNPFAAMGSAQPASSYTQGQQDPFAMPSFNSNPYQAAPQQIPNYTQSSFTGMQAQSPYAQQMSPQQHQQQQQPTSTYGNGHTNGASPQAFNQMGMQSFNNTGSSSIFNVGQPSNQPGSTSPFGGNAQPVQSFQTGSRSPIAPQSTNPFRQSMLSSNTAASPTSYPGSSTSSAFMFNSQQSSNPFHHTGPASAGSIPQSSPYGNMATNAMSSPFQTMGMQSQHQMQPPQAIQPTATGTNPFARSATMPTTTPSSPPPLAPQTTGTNPFRQSTWLQQQQQQSQGWSSH